jgi:hypothetical protein
VGTAGVPVAIGGDTVLTKLIHSSSPAPVCLIGSGFAGVALWWGLRSNRKLKVFEDVERGRYLMFIGVLLTLAWSSFLLVLSILVLMGALSV